MSWGAGAARGIRTPDPVITNDVLYQLSYCGEPCRGPREVGPVTRAPDIGRGLNWQGGAGFEMPLTRPSETRIHASRRPGPLHGPWACRFVP
jgi:hypothetical protein